MKIDSRSCSPDTGSNGCIDGNNKYIRNMMNGTITLLASLKYRFTIKGVNGCSCSEDLCNGGCAGTNILVGHKWYAFVQILIHFLKGEQSMYVIPEGFP